MALFSHKPAERVRDRLVLVLGELSFYSIAQRGLWRTGDFRFALGIPHAITHGYKFPMSESTRNAECESEVASPPQSSLCNGIEAQLTQYQNQAITDTLCRLVAEQGHLSHE